MHCELQSILIDARKHCTLAHVMQFLPSWIWVDSKQQSMWAEGERPICRSALKPIFVTPALRSVPAPRPPAPRSLPLERFLECPLTAPLPITPFSARSAPFPLRSALTCVTRGGFNGRPLVQWPTRPHGRLGLEAPGPRGPGRLNFGLQLQSPDCNLNWIYDLFKLETSSLIRCSILSEF